MTVDWAALLSELEASIADVERGGMARAIDLDAASLGPIPEELIGHATDLAARALRLELELTSRLAGVDQELGRHSPRSLAVAPPAPSHLDHLA